MTINIRDRQDVTILDLSGDLILAEGYDAVRNQVKELLAAGKKKILLNLAQVDYMDSGGLGVFIESLVSTRKRSGQLKLVHVGDKMKKLLELTKLGSFLEAYDSEDEALAALQRF